MRILNFDNNLILPSVKQTTLSNLAKGIIRFLQANNFKPQVLLSTDGETNTDFVLTTIASTLLKYGINVDCLSFCTCPSLAYIGKKFGYPLCIYIGHKKYVYFRLFNSLGEELSQKFENEIVALGTKRIYKSPTLNGKLKFVDKLNAFYIDFVKSIVKSNIPCIYAYNEKYHKIFKHIISKTERLKNASIEQLKLRCILTNKIGVKISNNGSEVLFVDTDGSIITGEKLLYLFSKFFLKYGDKIAFCTNPKNLISNMKIDQLTLGGNSNGYIILRQFSSTGDGLLNAILVLNLLSLSNMTFKELLLGFH